MVQSSKLGDRRAMEGLIRQYQTPVYNAAFRMLGNPDDAADVTQITFLKVVEKLDQYNPAYRFFSWLYRIALNESINRLKGRKKNESYEESSDDSQPTPDQSLDAHQTSSEIQSVLMELPSDSRAVIVLKYFTECSYKEMSQVLDLPEKTVKSRLFSARQLMKTKLETIGILSS